MTVIVLDSSVLIASILPDEPLSSQADALIAEQYGKGICAPLLFRSEVTAVIRKAVYTKRIGYDDGLAMLHRAFAAPITFYDDDALHIEAYKIAARFNLPRTYDSQYLALAERLDCDFWTTDEKLYNSIRAAFHHVRWLANFTLSQL